MELRQLRYFVAVAEELHFARAAARVGIEQSPLSKAIKDFEADLGVRLFTRTTRSTRLTHSGQLLLEDARHILASVETAEQSLRSAAAGRQGRVKLGLCAGLYHPRLSRLLAEWRAAHPEMELRVVTLPRGRLLNDVEAGLVDLGVATALEGEVPGVEGEVLWRDPLVVAMAANHRLAAQRRVSWMAIADEPVIISRCCGGEKIDGRLNVIEESADLEQLLTLVSAGVGVGLISAAYSELLLKTDLVLRPLTGRQHFVTTSLLHRKDDRSAQVSRFVQLARESARG
jgi:DNA-binding transcriptional LysR family regulator